MQFCLNDSISKATGSIQEAVETTAEVSKQPEEFLLSHS